MIIWTSSQCPLVLVLRLFDRQTVDGSQPQAHQPVLIELPILIAIRAKRIPGVVVPFIGTAYRDMIPLERPELFDQPIVQLLCPIAPEKRNDSLPATPAEPANPSFRGMGATRGVLLQPFRDALLARLTSSWIATVVLHSLAGVRFNSRRMFRWGCFVCPSRFAGKLKVKTEPRPAQLTTRMVPPCASTIIFAIDRPMPVPGTRYLTFFPR